MTMKCVVCGEKSSGAVVSVSKDFDGATANHCCCRECYDRTKEKWQTEGWQGMKNKMKLIPPEGLAEEMRSNTFFVNKYKEYEEACNNNLLKEFLDENQEFMQMMMNYASKVKIEFD